jgi:hypothetical protein
METTETDDRDCLSAGHRSFMERYIEFELSRQEKISKQFLASKLDQQGKHAPLDQRGCSGIVEGSMGLLGGGAQ